MRSFTKPETAIVMPPPWLPPVAAMRLLYQRAKALVEPSSAIALAAVLANRDRFAGMRVGVILTGGNLDLDALPW